MFVECMYVVGLMCVNYVGEVCVQVFYQVQKFIVCMVLVKVMFEEVVCEEEDYFVWIVYCLKEFDLCLSLFNLLWYVGVFVIGVVVGVFGDKVSFGFMVEMEWQVESYFEGYMFELLVIDIVLCVIVDQMWIDEVKYGKVVIDVGGIELLLFVWMLMCVVLKVMMSIVYYF